MIRLARAGDAEAIHAIYAPLVRTSVVSLEWEVPPVEAIAARIERTLERFPWLVCELDGQVLGYAYASPHRRRVSYRWSAEVSVYVHEDARRRGIGGKLYESLFELLRLQGYVNAFAIIGASNPASVTFHEALGFEKVAYIPSAGYKFSSWHDVMWMRNKLITPPEAPPPPKALPELDAGALAAVLRG